MTQKEKTAAALRALNLALDQKPRALDQKPRADDAALLFAQACVDILRSHRAAGGTIGAFSIKWDGREVVDLKADVQLPGDLKVVTATTTLGPFPEPAGG